MSADTTPTVTAAPAPAERQGPAYRWYVLALLFLLTIVNTIDRSIVPALAEPLKAEFQLSDSQFGFLAGVIYSLSYSVSVVPIGLLIDRVNRAKLVSCLAMILGGATMLLGTMTSFAGLVLTRIGVASAESGGSPTNISILSDYFPHEKRATAIGLLYSASGIASFLVFSLAGWIGGTYGWRTACVCAGAPAVVLGLLTFFTLREPKRGAFDPPAAAPAEKPGRVDIAEIGRTLIGNKVIRYLTLAATFTIFGVAGLGAFTASFFYRVHHLPLAQAGLVTGLVMGGAFAVGAVAGGFLSDVATKRSAGGGCYLVAAATFLAAPCAAAGFLTPNLAVSMLLLFVYKVLVGGFFGATFAGVTRAAPVAIRGAVTTFMMLLWNLCGAGPGPQVAGILSDRFAAVGYEDPLKWALVAVSSSFIVSAACFVLAGRSMKAASG